MLPGINRILRERTDRDTAPQRGTLQRIRAPRLKAVLPIAFAGLAVLAALTQAQGGTTLVSNNAQTVGGRP